MSEHVKAKLQSRKLWIAIGILLMGTAMLFFGKIESSQWVQIVQWVGPGYLLAQGAADALASR